MTAPILHPDDVASIAFRYEGTQIHRLALSHQVLADEVERLQAIVTGLADRVYAQSQLLSRRAEKPTELPA